MEVTASNFVEEIMKLRLLVLLEVKVNFLKDRRILRTTKNPAQRRKKPSVSGVPSAFP